LLVIGVTGGIGTGKSTLSSLLASHGAEIIDADKISKGIMKKGKKAYNDVVNAFGSDILGSDGEIDRKKLASIVFRDNSRLQLLNSLTHKYIIQEMLEKLNRIKSTGNTDICVLDVPIPVEHGFLDTADEIWVVTASLETRIKRIMNRDNMTRQEAEQRIAAQMSQEDYIKLADLVLENDGSVHDLEKKVDEYLIRKSYR